MSHKTRQNNAEIIKTLMAMPSEKRLLKALELSELTKQLFIVGLKKRFPEKNEEEIRKIYLERIAKCYNRNY